MTPKEKAMELVGKYEVTGLAGRMPLVLAKVYAEIAVDEILNGDHLIRTPLSFWQKVKFEINNL